jgi:hypothetical protein
VIRIDVHPAGENPTNTTCMLPTPVHIRLAYTSYGRSPYVATFRKSSTGLDGCTTPEKSAPDSTSQPDWVVRGTHLSFSPNTTIEIVHLSQAPADDRLLGLPGPYHRHAIGMFNTCSRVSTPRSLTNTGGGYHIETSEQPQHSPCPSLLSVSLIPLNGPVRSLFLSNINLQ